jgi:GTPase SAR1 family protein
LIFNFRYVNRKFSNQYKATIGADFLTKEVEIMNSGKIGKLSDVVGELQALFEILFETWLF